MEAKEGASDAAGSAEEGDEPESVQNEGEKQQSISRGVKRKSSDSPPPFLPPPSSSSSPPPPAAPPPPAPPIFVTPSKEKDESKPSSAKKRRRSTSSGLGKTASPASSPLLTMSTINLAGMTERQQMAFLLQMTDPLKKFESPGGGGGGGVGGGGGGGGKEGGKEGGTPSRIFKRNERGETPLHLACIRGELRLASSLIEQGADVNASDHAGWTPLHEACNHGYHELVSLLIQSGANVNTRGLGGDTPLHDATINNHPKVVKLLMDHGSDPNLANDREQTAFDVCLSQEIRDLLSHQRSSSTSHPHRSSADEDAPDLAQSLDDGACKGDTRIDINSGEDKKVTAVEPQSEEDNVFSPSSASHTSSVAQSKTSTMSAPGSSSTQRTSGPVGFTPSRARKRSKRERCGDRAAARFSDVSSSESDSELLVTVRKIPRLVDRLPTSVREEDGGEERGGEGRKVGGGGGGGGGGEKEVGGGKPDEIKDDKNGRAGERKSKDLVKEVADEVGKKLDEEDNEEQEKEICSKSDTEKEESDQGCCDVDKKEAISERKPENERAEESSVDEDREPPADSVNKSPLKDGRGSEEEVSAVGEQEDKDTTGDVPSKPGKKEEEEQQGEEEEEEEEKQVEILAPTSDEKKELLEYYNDDTTSESVKQTVKDRVTETRDVEVKNQEKLTEKTMTNSQTISDQTLSDTGSENTSRDVPTSTSTTKSTIESEGLSCDSFSGADRSEPSYDRKQLDEGESSVGKEAMEKEKEVEVKREQEEEEAKKAEEEDNKETVKEGEEEGDADENQHAKNPREAEPVKLILSIPFQNIKVKRGRGFSQLRITRTPSRDKLPPETSVLVQHGKVESVSSLLLRGVGGVGGGRGESPLSVEKMDTTQLQDTRGKSATIPGKHGTPRRGLPPAKKLKEAGKEEDEIGGTAEGGGWGSGVESPWEATPTPAGRMPAGFGSRERLSSTGGGWEGGVPAHVMDDLPSRASPTFSHSSDHRLSDDAEGDSEGLSDDSDSSGGTVVSLSTSLPIKFSRLQQSQHRPSPLAMTGSSAVGGGAYDTPPSTTGDVTDGATSQSPVERKSSHSPIALHSSERSKRPPPQTSTVTHRDTVSTAVLDDPSSLPPKLRIRPVLRSAVVQQRRENAGQMPDLSHLPFFLLSRRSLRKPHPPTNPQVVYPPVHRAMCQLFSEQESERFRLHSAHLAQQDRMLQCLEHELVRAHMKASHQTSTAATSVCAVLLERLLPRADAVGDERPSLETNNTPQQEGEQTGVMVDGRLLASLVQDVWDKFCNQRGVLLARQKHEAEALWLLQHQQWADRLKELGFCRHMNIPTVHVPKLPC